MSGWTDGLTPDRAALQKAVRDSRVFKPETAAHYHDRAVKTRASLIWVGLAQCRAEEFAASYREALGAAVAPEPEPEREPEPPKPARRLHRKKERPI